PLSLTFPLFGYSARLGNPLTLKRGYGTDALSGATPSLWLTRGGKPRPGRSCFPNSQGSLKPNLVPAKPPSQGSPPTCGMKKAKMWAQAEAASSSFRIRGQQCCGECGAMNSD